MIQIEKLIETLESKYNISITRFLELYQEGWGRVEVAEAMNTSTWKVRNTASTLNLRWAKTLRSHDYALFLSRFDETADARLIEELAETKEDLDKLSKDLVNREVALQRARVDLNKYRAAVRTTAREEEILAYIDDTLVQYNTLQEDESTAPCIYVDLPDPIVRRYGTQFVTLSDLHAEGAIKKTDVGTEDISWEDTIERIREVFNKLVEEYSGEEVLHVYMLGDMLQGTIHDALEATTKPIAEAVVDLAEVLATLINSVSSLYTAVGVFCVNGNHGRFTNAIKSPNKGFDFEYLLYKFIEARVVPNVHVIISTTGMCVAQVSKDTLVGLHHGDMFRGAYSDARALTILQEFKAHTLQAHTTAGAEVKHIAQGHVHKFSLDYLPTGGVYLTNGCLKGKDAYAHFAGYLSAPAVQTVGKWDTDGNLKSVTPITFR